MRPETNVEQRVERLLLNLGVQVPYPDTDVIEAGLLDSLALVQLIVDIEHDLGVELPLEEVNLEDFRTIEGIARLVRRFASDTTEPT